MLAGLAVSSFRGFDLLGCIGLVFLLFFGVDLFMTVVSLVFAKVFLNELPSPKVKQKKHSDGKHYQYIIKHNGREVWSYVYTRPLDQVKVRVFEKAGHYWFLVRRTA